MGVRVRPFWALHAIARYIGYQSMPVCHRDTSAIPKHTWIHVVSCSPAPIAREPDIQRTTDLPLFSLAGEESEAFPSPVYRFGTTCYIYALFLEARSSYSGTTKPGCGDVASGHVFRCCLQNGRMFTCIYMLTSSAF